MPFGLLLGDSVDHASNKSLVGFVIKLLLKYMVPSALCDYPYRFKNKCNTIFFYTTLIKMVLLEFPSNLIYWSYIFFQYIWTISRVLPQVIFCYIVCSSTSIPCYDSCRALIIIIGILLGFNGGPFVTTSPPNQCLKLFLFTTIKTSVTRNIGLWEQSILFCVRITGNIQC